MQYQDFTKMVEDRGGVFISFKEIKSNIARRFDLGDACGVANYIIPNGSGGFFALFGYVEETDKEGEEEIFKFWKSDIVKGFAAFYGDYELEPQQYDLFELITE